MSPIAIQPRALSARDKQNAGLYVRALSSDVTEINLYDEIGMWGVTAKAFREALNSVTTPTIKLNINSPGGDVFDGIAIFSDLIDHSATVDVRVTGLAASAASLIAMAGDTVTIAEHAFFMIHNAWTFSIGNKAQLEKDAQVLAKIDEQLADRYAQRTGQDLGDIVDMMDAETWLNADEAVELGFADDMSDSDDGEKARASFDLSNFKNVPRALKGAAKRSAKAKTTKGPLEATEVVPNLSPVKADLEALIARVSP